MRSSEQPPPPNCTRPHTLSPQLWKPLKGKGIANCTNHEIKAYMNYIIHANFITCTIEISMKKKFLIFE